MKKLIIGVAVATCISSVAMAEENKVSSVLNTTWNRNFCFGISL